MDLPLRPLQALLDRNVQASTPARALAAQLEGRSLRFVLRDTPLELVVCLRDGRVELTTTATEADAVLTATPAAIAALARGQTRAGELRIEGDAATARRFQSLFAHAAPDWEEELARLVGDLAAHHIGRVARGMNAWAVHSADVLRDDLVDYLQEERRLLPAPAEVEEFRRELERLQSAVAALGERVSRLSGL